MKEKELRQLVNERIEVREEQNQERRTIGGYALKYNSPTLIRDRWGDEWLEEFAQGAFDKSIEKKNQKALWNHDSSKPLGSVKAGTLRFIPDITGLHYEIDLPNNSWGNDVYEIVKRGDVDGSSFGFIPIDDVWSKVQYEGREVYKRSIIEAELIEVSPCTFPAYDSSSISSRSFQDFKDSLKDLQEKQELRKKAQKINLEIISMIGGIKNE
ncbi:HK97 family phage prohead protease [Caloramator proteoclasticus]|uniref:Prohead serine protease domain-containing protein n=1 Tax=Caloramator proteoclasticus DSM 10124 TaxID=1121262 RepID=A0A1M4ZET6_9CLOT|nr:HK97 family phage prohead protease [Caloramator proteoclasticus]SHF16488.1 prohead peptidase. Unknown type peptidase. MEROPS family U35 [Caloramator proteoclasticus DSM 10124]